MGVYKHPTARTENAPAPDQDQNIRKNLRKFSETKPPDTCPYNTPRQKLIRIHELPLQRQ